MSWFKFRNLSVIVNCVTKSPDMKFVQNFTPPDFQVKNFTPPISPNFNSFSKKKHKNLVKMEKFTPLATNFTLPPGLTGWTNFTSGNMCHQGDFNCWAFSQDPSLIK